MTLEQLLAVQDRDTALEQLRHRRQSLPERDELVSIDTDLAQLERDTAEAREQHATLAREQRRLEDEVALIEAKADEERTKLYGSGVTSPKEAQALQDEIESLHRHQSSLEDRILDLMEELEPLQAILDDAAATMTTLDQRRQQAQQRLATGEAEIDAEIGAVEADRDDTAGKVADDLLARYEAARPGFGSSTVVTFDGKNCVGCPLSMPAVEADRVKKTEPGTLVECSECGRLVVR